MKTRILWTKKSELRKLILQGKIPYNRISVEPWFILGQYTCHVFHHPLVLKKTRSDRNDSVIMRSWNEVSWIHDRSYNERMSIVSANSVFRLRTHTDVEKNFTYIFFIRKIRIFQLGVNPGGSSVEYSTGCTRRRKRGTADSCFHDNLSWKSNTNPAVMATIFVGIRLFQCPCSHPCHQPMASYCKLST